MTLGLCAENLSDLYDTGEEAGRGWQQELGAGRHRQDRQGNPGQRRHRPPDRLEGRRPDLRLSLHREPRTGSPRATPVCRPPMPPCSPRSYGSIIVMENMTYAEALPLYGLRQNIFTDPQKPMKVEAKIYPLNGADENSVCCPDCRLRPDLLPGLRRDGAEQLPCEPADLRCLRHVRPDRLGRR